jgi:hypothetical protein
MRSRRDPKRLEVPGSIRGTTEPSRGGGSDSRTTLGRLGGAIAAGAGASSQDEGLRTAGFGATSTARAGMSAAGSSRDDAPEEAQGAAAQHAGLAARTTGGQSCAARGSSVDGRPPRWTLGGSGVPGAGICRHDRWVVH